MRSQYAMERNPKSAQLNPKPLKPLKPPNNNFSVTTYEHHHGWFFFISLSVGAGLRPRLKIKEKSRQTRSLRAFCIIICDWK